jgi:hypothetical protein
VVSADAKNQNDPKLMVSDHEGLEATLKFTRAEPPMLRLKEFFNQTRLEQVE